MGRSAYALAAAAAALAATVAVASEGDSVLELTPDNFKTVVGGSKPAFVKFYAPWCGHCKSLAPDWVTLAETFPESSGVVVAKVDADKYKELGSEYDVKGFPTLKYFPAGSTKPDDYSGGRSIDDLVKFLNGKLGTSKKVKKPVSAVIDLDASNLDTVLGDPTKAKLFEAYAPWCGHCKHLAPTYEKLGAAFEGDPDVVITRLDADAHKDLGQRFGVSSYPTLKWIPKGKTGKPEEIAEEYTGGRELEDFVTFINKNAGTARDSKGGLLPSAGRVPALDDLAASFSDAPKANLEEAKAIVAELKGADAAKADAYLKVMAKIIEKGPSYPAKEVARIAGLMSSESITKAKKFDLQLKANVLKAFIKGE